MDEKILVSIITPIYKGQKYIPNLFRMVKDNSLNFTKGNLEFVLVNDFPEIPLCIENESNENFTVQIIENEENLGIQGARINGVRAAKGNFIVMLDQDDEILPNAIESQFSKLKTNDAVISNGFYEDIKLERKSLYKSLRQLEKIKDLVYYCNIGNMIASPGLSLIKKEAIPVIWLENIMKINGADDWLLWVAFLLNGGTFSLNEDSLYIHKKVENNTSDDENRMLLSSEEALKILLHNYAISTKQRKMFRTYSRRLRMRKRIMNKGNLIKYCNYLINADIAFFLLYYKILGLKND